MKSKKTNPFVITTLIFFMTTVMFGLLTTGVIIKYRKATVAANTDKLSNDEIEKLKSEEKEDLLSDMKLRDRKSTRLNSSHVRTSRMPSSA